MMIVKRGTVILKLDKIAIMNEKFQKKKKKNNRILFK